MLTEATTVCRDMRAILVRAGVDKDSGQWNAPVDTRTGEFVYVPIPETKPVRAGLQKPYATLVPILAKFGKSLPSHLLYSNMHLDPDFAHLTYGDYGDTGQRGKELSETLEFGDVVVFYASFRDVAHPEARLVYALIGMLTVRDIPPARDIHQAEWDTNAHSRRVLSRHALDIVIRGQLGNSGRFDRCVPIGEFRNKAYRVRKDILNEWGGLSIKDGYLQRSIHPPRLCEPKRFMRWLTRQKISLVQANN
jgi:hypothetical protein